LKKLVLSCDDAANLKYVRKGIQLYQRKGNDFSEEVCNFIIKACIRFDDLKMISDLICMPGHRIGAWLSSKSAMLLINELETKKDVDTIVNVYKAILVKDPKKFGRMKNLEYLFKIASIHGNAEIYHSLVQFCTKYVCAADLEQLQQKFRVPPKQEMEN